MQKKKKTQLILRCVSYWISFKFMNTGHVHYFITRLRAEWFINVAEGWQTLPFELCRRSVEFQMKVGVERLQDCSLFWCVILAIIYRHRGLRSQLLLEHVVPELARIGTCSVDILSLLYFLITYAWAGNEFPRLVSSLSRLLPSHPLFIYLFPYSSVLLV